MLLHHSGVMHLRVPVPIEGNIGAPQVRQRLDALVEAVEAVEAAAAASRHLVPFDLVLDAAPTPLGTVPGAETTTMSQSLNACIALLRELLFMQIAGVNHYWKIRNVLDRNQQLVWLVGNVKSRVRPKSTLLDAGGGTFAATGNQATPEIEAVNALSSMLAHVLRSSVTEFRPQAC